MPTSPSEPFLEQLTPEHRQLVINGAQEEAITRTEWIERAVVLRAGERGVSAAQAEAHVRSHHARPHEPVLEGLHANHRALVEAGAADEAITAKEWLERAVVLQTAHRPVRRAATEHAAAHASTLHATSGRASEEVVREEIETRRETEHIGPAPRPQPRPAEHRPEERRAAERGFSAYHSHVAARAAAAEEVPLDIWMEQAILERAGYRGREAVRPPPPPLPPPPPPPPPAYPYPPPAPPPSSSPGAIVVGQGGGLVAGVLLGVLLAIVLILFLSWIRSGGRIDGASGSGAQVQISNGGSGASPGGWSWLYAVPTPGPAPPAPTTPPVTPSQDDKLSTRGAGPSVAVTTQIYEASRTSSVRRAVRRTWRGGENHYGYIDEGRRWADSTPPAPPAEQPSRVWTPDCGCDRDVYGRADGER
jgi:hypothetical protein